MKKAIALALSLTMALSLVACGPKEKAPDASKSDPPAASQSTPNPEVPADLTNITLATGGSSGTYYAVGGVLASMLQNTGGIKTDVVSTGASKDNVQGITDGLYNMAILQGDVLSYAHTGADMFEGAVEETSLWVAGIYNETVQIIATPDITDVSQLKGKAVCVGDAGSGTEFNARQVLEAYGLTFNDIDAQNGSFQDGVDNLKDGKISAAFTVAGAPTTAIVDLAASGTPFNLVSLTDEAVKTITTDYPFLVQDNLPGDTYDGHPDETVCVAVKAVLVASEDLDEDTVYAATKTMFENLEPLTAGHPKFGYLSTDSALDGASVAVHPGAARYYQEIGVALP